MRTRVIYTCDPTGFGRLRRGLALAAHLAADGPVTVIGHEGVDWFTPPDGVTLRALPTRSKGDLAAERVALLREIADEASPGLLIVDCEPAGWKGELALSGLLGRCPAVLVMRDIYGDADAVWRRWREHGAFPALERYRAVWIAGTAAMGDPLEGVTLPETLPRLFLGYPWHPPRAAVLPARGRIVVTVGGGRDGAGIIGAALEAAKPGSPLSGLLAVCGPNMPDEAFAAIRRRAAAAGPFVEAVRFDPELAASIAVSDGVVAMAGAGTFADILCARQRALLVPRRGPGIEQSARAERAAALGMVSALPVGALTVDGLARHVAAMMERPRPSTAGWMMDPGQLRRLAAEAAR